MSADILKTGRPLVRHSQPEIKLPFRIYERRVVEFHRLFNFTECLTAVDQCMVRVCVSGVGFFRCSSLSGEERRYIITGRERVIDQQQPTTAVCSAAA
jgi:hypothetical protein